MRIICVIMILAFAALCYANDGAAVGEGGSMRFMKGEHPSIRMVKEWVKMDVYTHYYNVYVKFIFTNDGAATNVKMGFPEKGGGEGVNIFYYRTHSAYSHFRTRVDGKAVIVKRTALIDKTFGDYDALWVKTVHFRRGQTRMIEVSYRSTPGNTSMGDSNVSYAFSGGNWKGIVNKSDLQVTLHLPGTIFYESDFKDKTVSARQNINGNRLSYSWKNWQADGPFSLSYYNTDPNWIKLVNENELYNVPIKLYSPLR